MTSTVLPADLKLQRALTSCLACATQPQAPNAPEVCYEWANSRHETQFQKCLSKTDYQRLHRLGFLVKSGSARGGKRRYYAIPDAAQLRLLISGLGLAV